MFENEVIVVYKIKQGIKKLTSIALGKVFQQNCGIGRYYEIKRKGRSIYTTRIYDKRHKKMNYYIGN